MKRLFLAATFGVVGLALASPAGAQLAGGIDVNRPSYADEARQLGLPHLQSEALEYLIQVFTEDERNRAADVRRFLQEIGGEKHVERITSVSQPSVQPRLSE